MKLEWSPTSWGAWRDMSGKRVRFGVSQAFERVSDAQMIVHQRVYQEVTTPPPEPVELVTMGCRCRFTGSLADQVFTCMSCGAFPDECSDGECGCLVA